MKKLIVHGVHRSGTSLTASLLQRAGFWYAEQKYRMPPQADNPKGFWERLDVVDINERMLASQNMDWFSLRPEITGAGYASLREQFGSEISSMLHRMENHGDWFLKDPRFTVTWPVWKDLVAATHHIVVHRHPVGVAMSLNRRNGIPIKQGLIFWYHQTRMLANALKDEESVFNILFDAEGTCEQQTNRVIQEICGSSETSTNEAELNGSMFDANLIHHKQVDESQLQDYPLIAQAFQLAQQGKLQELAELPVIEPAELQWADLDSPFAYASALEKFERELTDLDSVLQEQRRANLKLEEERSKVAAQKQELEESSAELKLSKLKTAAEIRRYMLSSQYVFSSLFGKMIAFLRLGKFVSLYPAFDLAKHGHSATELEQALPRPSNRYLLLKALFTKPGSFLRRLSLRRVIKALKTLAGKGEDDAGVQQALLQYSNLDLPFGAELKLYDPDDAGAWRNKQISFPDHEQPTVSIVIPVYNNYLTTLACLHSLQDCTDFSGTKVQIVIADDCSTDETKTLANQISGVRVIRSPSNLGFLKNCNHALSQVHSEYVVLLNNDTNVQQGWLTELLQPLQSHADVGVTGPMFLYPDGRLQEAGGIIFSDASGWNYGRFDRPDKPEYNFARDVDYVSGACMVFRKSLWDQLGGFDEKFAPAYYEDTDFCFAARALGQSVRYVPSARVVHFEGVSHGSDEESGIKRYQAINRDQFADKWRQILQQQHHQSSEQLFLARNHGKDRPTLLFIDHHVPFYDKDAGSKVAQRYIELLIEEGVHVIFMGENFYPHQPYTQELQAMGVEVLYGEHYKNNWFEWLQANSAQINAIYLNRPHIAEVFIDRILSLDKVPHLSYHGADLHYLRVAREEKLGIANSDGKTATEWKKLEFDLMRKCDVSLWLSETEVDRVREEDASVNTAYMPMYWFSEGEFDKDVVVTEEPSLLFVGSFTHPPNRDGLEWFLAEVFPSVIEQVPDARLSIIGSNCPQDILDLQNPNIEVLGFVSEAELEQAYKNSRVAVVPLRYGAGVKGKVIESMLHGVPVVTTQVGAEGLAGDPADYLSVFDDPEEYAERIITLLNGQRICEEQIARAQIALTQHYSKEAARAAVSMIAGLASFGD